MDDALTILLNEAVNGGFTEDELRLGAADAETAIAKAREKLADAESAIEDNAHSIKIRQQRSDTMAAETAKRRSSYNKKFYAGTYKSSLVDESAERIQEDMQHSILLDSVRYGESLIEGLYRAKRLATRSLLASQGAWCRAQGLVECAVAFRLFSEVLRNDANAKIDLKGTKCDSYARKVTEFENLIHQFDLKEATYGNQ
jgi:hypothetical protein